MTVVVAASDARREAKRELLKTLLEGSAAFLELSAKMQEIFVKEEQALIDAGMNFIRLADTGLVPRLMGNDHTDLIGKYVLCTIEIGDVLRETADPYKLTIDQRRQKAKRFLDLSEELKSIAKEALT